LINTSSSGMSSLHDEHRERTVPFFPVSLLSDLGRGVEEGMERSTNCVMLAFSL